MIVESVKYFNYSLNQSKGITLKLLTSKYTIKFTTIITFHTKYSILNNLQFAYLISICRYRKLKSSSKLHLLNS